MNKTHHMENYELKVSHRESISPRARGKNYVLATMDLNTNGKQVYQMLNNKSECHLVTILLFQLTQVLGSKGSCNTILQI